MPAAFGQVADDEQWAVDCPVGVWWHDPGKIALSYGELIRKPAVEPVICQPCLGDLFWEDIAGRMHCIECDRVPSLRMVKDFWWANNDGEKNAAGEWIATGWSRWFPKNDTLERLFAHLAAADQQRQAAAAAASGF